MIPRIFVFVVLGAGIVAAQPSATVGSVRGLVLDRGVPAAGAVIVATSPAMPGAQTAIADERGAYFLSNLPPGAYRLDVYYLDAQFTRDNVLVQLGKQAVVVNVLTKQGGNELHGSFFAHYTPRRFVADAAAIQREGNAIDSRTELATAYDLGTELGGPIVRDALWFHVGYAPHVTRDTTTRIIASQVDEDGDGRPDLDPVTGFTVHRTLSELEIPTRTTTHYFTAKLTGAIGEEHRGALFAFGNPSTGTTIHRGLFVAPESLMATFERGSYNIGGTWTSKLYGGQTEIAASAGLHRTYDLPVPVDSRVSIGYGFERSLFDFADIEQPGIDACRDATDPSDQSDPYPSIINCPVSSYATQGGGTTTSRRDERLRATLALTHRLRLAGYHVLKLGLDAEHAADDGTLGFSGGFALRRNPDLLGARGSWRRTEIFRFVRELTDAERANPGALAENEEICREGRALCAVADPLEISIADTNLGTYLQDSWLITPTLTVNAGVRWDHQIGYVGDDLAGRVDGDGQIISERVLTLDNVAPRLGVVHDPSGAGRAKLFAHVGRFYETLPLTATSVFNSGFAARTRFPRNAGPRCDADHGTPNLIETVLSCETRQPRELLEALSFVAPGLRGQYTDELVAGAELEIVSDLKVGAAYQRRRMPVVIDDVSLDGGNNLFIANPGENFDAEAAEMRAKADRLETSADPDERELAETLRTRAGWLENLKELDQPIRDHDAVLLTLTLRPTARSLLLGSYTYSRTRGNYPGLFNPDTGQLNPNINAIYDLPSLLANRYGALPMDRPHNLRVDGFYRFDLGAHSLTTGAGVRVQSGVAYTALGAHTQYGAGESYLLPAGMLGRTPPVAQLDVHLAFARRFAKDSALEAFIDVLNLFDAQTELAVDQRYTRDAANPVTGGMPADLEHVKAIDPDTRSEQSRTVKRNPNFANTTARQRPRMVQLGVRWMF